MSQHDLTDSGLRFCVAHQGFVDVDQDTCDFHRLDLDEYKDDAVTECVTRPLLYDATGLP